MKFRSGQLIDCVDDTPAEGRVFTIKKGALKRNATYTFRDYVAQGDWIPPLLTDERCLRVHEIVRRYDGLGFRESRFRAHADRPLRAASKKERESA